MNGSWNGLRQSLNSNRIETTIEDRHADDGEIGDPVGAVKIILRECPSVRVRSLMKINLPMGNWLACQE